MRRRRVRKSGSIYPGQFLLVKENGTIIEILDYENNGDDCMSSRYPVMIYHPRKGAYEAKAFPGFLRSLEEIDPSLSIHLFLIPNTNKRK